MLGQKSAGGVFESLKNRLGFSNDQSDYDGAYSDADYDDYDNYGDYGDYGDDYAEYSEYADGAYNANNVEENTGYITRTVSRGAHASSRSSSSYRSSFPRLVSIEDVRANAQIADRYSSNSDRYSSDSSASRWSSSTSTSSRGSYSGSYSGSGASPSYRSRSFGGAPRSLERAADYMRSTETSDLPPDDSYQTNTQESFFPVNTGAYDATDSSDAASSYDPYEVYSGFGAASHAPTRAVVVLQPKSYADAERISKTVKAGDAAVLVLRGISDSLAKRILDFSFGASSALGASVDCIADKIFVIANGSALSAEEIAKLRREGVLS